MASTLHSYRELLSNYLRPQWRKMALLSIALFSDIGLRLLNPQVIRYYLDTVINTDALWLLVVAALIFLVIGLIQQIIAVAVAYLSETVAWTATNHLRANLILHCLQLDMTFHHTHTPGELIERIEGDVNKLTNVLSQFIIQIVGNGILLVGVLFLLGLEDWRLGMTMTVFVVISLVVLRRLQPVGEHQWNIERQASASLSAFWEEWLTGMEDIRSSGTSATAYVRHRLPQLLGDQLRKERLALLIGNTGRLTTIMLFAVSSIVVFAIGAWLFQRQALTVGGLYLIFAYSQIVIQPIKQITDQLHDLQQAGAVLKRIQELLQTKPSIQDGVHGYLPPGALSVEFDTVTFGYTAESPILHDISFCLEANQVLGVLGHTGSGKTTLTRLLIRLYDPTFGTIRVGGRELLSVPVADLRQRICMVTQDVQLFAGTIRDNLTFFDPIISDAQILEAVHNLELGYWYNSLPHGLDTVLRSGEGGLSAGEAQLLAFTRIFLYNPGLVILDEASSRLDPATEALIDRAVERLLQGRTAIIIAHRLATVQRADKILILDNGVICEYGARVELANDPNSRFSSLSRTSLEIAQI